MAKNMHNIDGYSSGIAFYLDSYMPYILQTAQEELRLNPSTPFKDRKFGGTEGKQSQMQKDLNAAIEFLRHMAEEQRKIIDQRKSKESKIMGKKNSVEQGQQTGGVSKAGQISERTQELNLIRKNNGQDIDKRGRHK